MIVSLKEHKDKKKIKKYIEDIDNVLKIIFLSQKGLSIYKQYSAVQEMVSILETNKIILEMHKKKYEGKLEEIEKKHSQSSTN
jgi:hypothetical protein